ncbi:uncharacterized protein LOC124887076 [Capsicum annuum]|uniref:uncharacterized protein LOC124887076 n=1 Tax=Capsicum annuum TaxID=4072 RepID=UPI001FB0AEB7|nr:uncharacterized protein LOC124887076 [Capsicum annuum]
MVFAWLSNSLSKDIAETVLRCETARDIWSDLEERYGQSNANRYYQIQREIAGISQGSSDIATYYTRSNILMISPVPTLGKAYSMLLHDENQREIQSSPPSFIIDHTSFTVKENNFPPTSVASPSPSTSHTSHNSMKSYNERTNFDNKKPIGVCKYCKKPGHSVDQYYRLHGFPPDFKFTKNKKSASCAKVDNSSLESSRTPDSLHGFTPE